MLATSLRPGLLAGSFCGIIGAALLVGIGLSRSSLAIWLLYLILLPVAGLAAAWMVARPAEGYTGPLRRADLIRAGAIGGAAAAVWLGVLLTVLSGLVIMSGAMQGQIGDLLSQNGLAADTADTLQSLLVGCSFVIFVFILPLFAAGLGALAALIYSFVRPPHPQATRPQPR
jgi:hypothetical protein